MATRISYLDELFSPITGCSGKGCATKETCWAKGMVKRFSGIHGFWPQNQFESPSSGAPIPFDEVQFHPDRLDQPLRWKKPRRVGVCFMGDLFDGAVPFEWVHKVFNAAFFSGGDEGNRHSFYFLTKQPKRMAESVEAWKDYLGGQMPIRRTWWLGVSCCTQADLDRMVTDLLRVPGKLWISVEPCMGKIILPLRCEKCGYSKADQLIHWDHKLCDGEIPDIGWVVIGSHSNPHRYPCKLEWVESVVEQCQAAGVKVYVKQLDINVKCVRDIDRFPKHLQVREIP